MMTKTGNKRRMVTTALSVLPEEMEMEVLLRLPVKSILRFSAVCRRWAALLSSDEFCSAWTKIAESTTTEPAAQLLFLPLPPWTDDRSPEVRSGDGRRLLTIDGVRSHGLGGDHIMLAPCRGLILLYDGLSLSGAGGYHVFNAATRATTMLPASTPSSQDGKRILLSSAGLGIDAKTKEYKVVRLFSREERHPRNGEKFRSIKCEVHALGRGSDRRWRPASLAVAESIAWAALLTASWYKMTPVFADGFLHWLVNPVISKSIAAIPAVLSFSVADETFSSSIRPPPFDWDDGGGRPHLTELHGRLCMVLDLRRRNPSLLEIWSYSNGGDCWSVEHRIDLAAHRAAGRFDLIKPRYVRVVGGSFGKKKVIFIATSRCKVVAYDPKSGTLETIIQFGGETSSSWETSRSLTKVSLFKESLTPLY